MTLSGKTAFITGASRGIGRATALTLASQGADIAVNFLSAADRAADVVKAVQELGRHAIAVQADVRDLAQLEESIQAATAELGEIGILVNNAGITRDKPAAFMSDDEWDEVVDTSMKGTFHCIKLLSRGMARSRWGRIINISSDAALMGDLMRVNYAAAKAGIIGLTKAMARELAASGITVNAIAPGFIETNMTAGMSDAKRNKVLNTIPQARFGTADEIAAVIAFLASDDAAYMTGQVIAVDGGMHM